MKKNLRSLFSPALIGALMLAGTWTPVYAQTLSIQDLIATLQKQIETLKGQLAALETTRGAVHDTLKVISQLHAGMSGEDIKLLQEILAADPDVYPEGTISGYYGRRTAQAVKRFQAKHGLEQMGHVGPKTLQKLNEELDKNPITKEDSTQRHCAIVPPGHLIAPGWLRKHDGVAPVVPPCQALPPGIAAKLGLATTTPPIKDHTAPIIHQVSATGITSTSTHITWMTNEPATSKVWYGTSTPAVSATAWMVSDGTLVSLHDLTLSNLAATTTYYYVVGSSDAAGNTATSSETNFHTLSQ